MNLLLGWRELPRDRISGFTLLLASTFVLFYGLILILSSILLLVGGQLSIFIPLIALSGAFIYYGILADRFLKLDRQKVLLGYLILVTTTFVGYFLSKTIYDLSWDGRDYHQRAIYELMQGWNPIYEYQDTGYEYRNAWLNHYPKGPWIAAASLNLLSGNIEVGKTINLLLISAVFLTAFSVLSSFPKLKYWEVVLVSGLIAANPVSVYQSFSYYVDGQVSSIFILLILLVIRLLREPDFISLIMLACTMVIGMNIKLTASAYTSLILVTLLILLIFYKRKSMFDKVVTGVLFLSIILAILVVGFDPYLKNTVYFGHPFYPTYGADQFNKEFLLANQLPSNFVGQSWIRKLFLSVFSASQNNIVEPAGGLKLPFYVTINEIKVFKYSDVRVAGWGPLFALELLISITVGVLLLFRRRGSLLAGLGLVLLIISTLLLNSEAWWARYAPQLWLVPIIMLVIAMLNRADRTLRIATLLLLVVVSINVFLVSGAYLTGNLIDSIKMRATLQEISASGDEILVYYGALDSTEHKLKEFSIPFTAVTRIEMLPCPQELVTHVWFSSSECP